MTLKEKYWNILLITTGLLWLTCCALATFLPTDLYYRPQSFTEDGKGIRTVEIFQALGGIVFALATLFLLWKAYAGNKYVWIICLLLIDFIFVETLYLLTQDYFMPGFSVAKCVLLSFGIIAFTVKMIYMQKIKRALLGWGFMLTMLRKPRH